MIIRFEDATLKQLDFLLGVAPFVPGCLLDILVGWTEGVPISHYFYNDIYEWAEKMSPLWDETLKAAIQ